MKPGVTPRQEMEKLAVELRAIGEWQQDSVMSQVGSAYRLIRAAYWLKEAARVTCGQGYVGCRGGDQCDSDHK